MKRTASFLISLLALLTACTDKNDFGDGFEPSLERKNYHFKVSPTDVVQQTSTGGTHQLTITTNDTWTATSNSTWMQLSQREGSGDATVTMTIGDNNSIHERRDTTIFRSGHQTEVKVVTIQAARYLKVDVESLSLSDEGETKTFTVDTDGSFTVTSSDPSWLTASKQGNVVSVTAKENDSGNGRNGRVTVAMTGLVAGEELKAEVPVSQAYVQVFYFDVKWNNNQQQQPSKGGTRTVSITSNDTWTATSSSTWMQLSQREGSGDATVTMTIGDNNSIHERRDTTIFRSGHQTEMKVVTIQAARYMKVDVESLSLSDEGETKTFTVDTDGSFTVTSSDPSWLTASKQGNVVSVTAKENDSGNGRNGRVTVAMTGLVAGEELKAEVPVSQAYVQKVFDVKWNNSQQQQPSKGGTRTVSITSNDTWTATSSSTWMQLSQKSGSGDATVTMTIGDNNSIHERRDVTTFRSGHQVEVEVVTVQSGRYLTVSPKEDLVFPAEGGTSQSFTVDTDASYTVTSSESWLTINRQGNSFTATAPQNSSGSERKATITVAMTGLMAGESYEVALQASQPALPNTGTDNGHEWVDLGLSVCWATTNVGASKPGDYGDYYAWGETSTKSTYDWSTYKYCNGSNDSMTKYCTYSSYGTVDNKTVLESSDDVAHLKWGGGWRMPSIEELKELKEKCKWEWTQQDGHSGYRVTGPNGNSIFLPAAGDRGNGSLSGAGSYGYYWSRTLSEYYPNGARYLIFQSGYIETYGNLYRYYGISVRPVRLSE